MKLSHLALVVVLSAATAFVVGTYVSPTAQTVQAKETAYQRVMRTGTLRCGYILFPHLFMQDVNSKKFYGFYFDVYEEIGRRLNLKVEWTEEVGMATAFDGMTTKRYDALCAPFVPTPARARVAEFVSPIIFLPEFIYARADDTRFDNNLSNINDPSIKVAVLEGEMGQTIKNEDYPKASLLSLPNLTDPAQLPLTVSTGKADVYLSLPSTAQTFMEKNPNQIKRVSSPPVRMLAASSAVGVGEEELKSLLNTTIESLHSTGYIERLFIKKPEDKDMYFLPAQPWRRAAD